MAEPNRSIWANSTPAATTRAPYGDPLADPFKAKPAGPRAGQFERLPKILGPLHEEQMKVLEAFAKSGKPRRRSDATRIFVGTMKTWPPCYARRMCPRC